MGRTKTSLEFITKEKTRNVTYLKRKKGLIKKASELAILCNVPVCMIMCPYKEGKQILSPEVFSFLGDERPKEKSNAVEPSLIDLAQAKDPKKAQAIIERYLAIPEEERRERSLNLNDMFDKWIKKEEQDLSLREKNALAKYPISNSLLDNFTPDQLNELLVQLDQKLEYVNQKITLEKSKQTALVPFVEEPKPFSCLMNQAALVPFVEEPKLISCVMNPCEDHAQYDGYHQGEMGGKNVNVFNQFPVFNYAMTSNIQESHQLVQFYPIVHPDQKPQVAGDLGNKSCNMVTYNYYMKMMGMSSVYLNQGSAAAGSVPEASSFYRTLPLPMPIPMPMPLQLPKPSGVPLPRDYQMSDK